MPTVRSSGLLREIAISPCASGRFQQIGRFRREAIELVEREGLLQALRGLLARGEQCPRVVGKDVDVLVVPTDLLGQHPDVGHQR